MFFRASTGVNNGWTAREEDYVRPPETRSLASIQMQEALAASYAERIVDRERSWEEGERRAQAKRLSNQQRPEASAWVQSRDYTSNYQPQQNRREDNRYRYSGNWD